jgi:hypothetical protein
MASKLNAPMFKITPKEVDFLSIPVDIGSMKTNPLSIFAWFASALFLVALLASCSTQGQQSCSAYQGVEAPAHSNR